MHQGWHYAPSAGVIGGSGSRVVEYCYANDTNATMKASITILPKYSAICVVLGLLRWIYPPLENIFQDK